MPPRNNNDKPHRLYTFKDCTDQTIEKALKSYRLADLKRTRQQLAHNLPMNVQALQQQQQAERSNICITNTNNIRNDDGVQHRRIEDITPLFDTQPSNPISSVVDFGDQLIGNPTPGEYCFYIFC